MASADSDDFGTTARGPFAKGMAGLRRLLAPRCVVCDLEAGDPLCPGCAHDYFAVDAPRCASCAIRLPAARSDDRCGACLRSPPRFDRTVALADYAPPVDRMIAALKFGGRLPLADAFGICPDPLAF